MVDVGQNQITRQWGFKVIEGDVGSIDSSNMGIVRVICEDFSYNSPQEVFAIVHEIQKALSSNFYKIDKEGIVYGYHIYSPSSRQVIFEESGWMDQSSLQEHISKIKENISGNIKMATIPKATVIKMGDTTSTSQLKSTYTDPITGKTYDSGQQNININLDEIRKQAQLDNEE